MSDNIIPVNVVMKIPAKLPAKFIMPVIDATCFDVGAISPTIAYVLAPAKDKLAYDKENKAKHNQTFSTTAQTAIQEEINIPNTKQNLRENVAECPCLKKASDVKPPSQLPKIPQSGGSIPKVPNAVSEKPLVSIK